MKVMCWKRKLTFCSTCAGKTSLNDVFDTVCCLFTFVVLKSLYYIELNAAHAGLYT